MAQAEKSSKIKKIVLICLAAFIIIGLRLSYLHMQQLLSEQRHNTDAPTESTMLSPGQKAPDFTLPAFPSKTVSLSAFKHRKNVILAFYPRDNSRGCTREMCTLSEDLDRFKSADTEVLGISCDSVDSHKNFSSDCGLKQPLLSDPDGKTAEAYGVKVAGKLKAHRVTFVINKDGYIQNVMIGMPDDGRLVALLHSIH